MQAWYKVQVPDLLDDELTAALLTTISARPNVRSISSPSRAHVACRRHRRGKLADPQTHASRAYNLTGPEALTVAEAAAIISDETGQTIKHVDLDRDAWIAGAIANGIPPEYGAVLRQLTETIASGHGSRPNGTVEKITGRPPRTFRNFARSNANAWRAAK